VGVTDSRVESTFTRSSLQLLKPAVQIAIIEGVVGKFSSALASSATEAVTTDCSGRRNTAHDNR